MIKVIDDLANLNFNYHITVDSFSVWPTYDSQNDLAEFTLWISSISVIFKNDFTIIIKLN